MQVINLFTRQQVAISNTQESIESKTGYDHTRECFLARFSNDLPKYVNCMYKIQNEPYMFGDSGDCKWSKYRNNELKAGRWNKPYAFPCEVKAEISEIGKTVFKGGTDPLGWMDRKYQTAFNHIKARQGKALKINTRSDLIATEDYTNVLDKDNHEIVMFIPAFCDSDEVRKMEPGCASIKRRKSAVSRLKEIGVKVSIQYYSIKDGSLIG